MIFTQYYTEDLPCLDVLFGRCQIFNSLERFSLALKTENIFANQLENFIKLEERRLHQLKV